MKGGRIQAAARRPNFASSAITSAVLASHGVRHFAVKLLLCRRGGGRPGRLQRQLRGLARAKPDDVAYRAGRQRRPASRWDPYGALGRRTSCASEIDAERVQLAFARDTSPRAHRLVDVAARSFPAKT